MKLTLLITTAVLAATGVTAGGDTCDVYKWHDHEGYGGQKQCAPSGYYQSYEYPECSDYGSLNQKCDDHCNKDSGCGGYVAYLNKYKSSYRGKCHYYKERPTNPQHCESGYPSQIYCRYRSPILNCFYKSKEAAKMYCSSLLQSTKYETTYVTPTITKTSTYTPKCTKTTTVTTTVCNANNGGYYPVGNHPRAEEAVEARAPIPAPAMITNEARNNYPAAPACLSGYNYEPAKITSACSCIGVTSTCVTKYETKTGWPKTVYTTKTAHTETVYATAYTTKYKNCNYNNNGEYHYN